MIKSSEHTFSWNGDTLRVVVAGDVIALPHEGWSRGGFGRSISEEWLLHSGELPKRGGKARRQALARCIVAALDAHHEDLAERDRWLLLSESRPESYVPVLLRVPGEDGFPQVHLGFVDDEDPELWCLSTGARLEDAPDAWMPFEVAA